MLAPRALPVPVVCARRLQRALPKDNLPLGVKPSAPGADSHHPGLCPRPSNCWRRPRTLGLNRGPCSSLPGV